MKKLIFAIMVAGVFLSTATFAQTVVGPSGVVRAILKVGDYWNYRTYDGRSGIASNEVTREVTDVSNEGITVVSKYKSGTVTIRTFPLFEKVDATTSNTQLKFPLYVGSSWDVKVDYDGGGYHGSEEFKATVVGWEEIKIPAGTFSALKITWEGFFFSLSNNGSTGGTGRIEIVRWYAPALKQVIKEVYKETYWGGKVLNRYNITELMTYKLATD